MPTAQSRALLTLGAWQGTDCLARNPPFPPLTVDAARPKAPGRLGISRGRFYEVEKQGGPTEDGQLLIDAEGHTRLCLPSLIRPNAGHLLHPETGRFSGPG